jgi:hypothetical protein
VVRFEILQKASHRRCRPSLTRSSIRVYRAIISS